MFLTAAQFQHQLLEIMIPTWQSSYKNLRVIILPYKKTESSLFECKFIYIYIEKNFITDIFYLVIDNTCHTLNT